MLGVQPRRCSNRVLCTGQSGHAESPHEDFLVYASESLKGSNRMGKSIRLCHHKIVLMICSFKSLGHCFYMGFSKHSCQIIAMKATVQMITLAMRWSSPKVPAFVEGSHHVSSSWMNHRLQEPGCPKPGLPARFDSASCRIRF